MAMKGVSPSLEGDSEEDFLAQQEGVLVGAVLDVQTLPLVSEN